MGNWQLEVAKMAMYIAFPVALFHYFNQPEYFESWVTEKKRELFPPDDQMHREEIQKAIHDLRSKRNEELMRTLQAIERKSL